VDKGEITSYYLRLADDYRQKYMEAERLMGDAREANRREVEAAAKQVECRLTKIIEDERSQHLGRIIEKDREIDALKRAVAEQGARQQAEEQERERIMEAQSELEREYGSLREDMARQLQEREDRVAALTKDLMFLHQAQAQERLKLVEQHRREMDEALSFAYEASERRFKDEMEARVREEVRRIDMEKQDRADAQLLKQNEKLRKQLTASTESCEYLERLLEKMQGDKNEISEENRDMRRKVKKLEYILYGKKGGGK
jgi:hypothetical protein